MKCRTPTWKSAEKSASEIRSFEKGLADRGGWSEDALHRPEIEASFLYPLSYAPLGEGGQISGELCGLFFGVCLSATASRQPLIETSEESAGPTGVPRKVKKKVLRVPRLLKQYRRRGTRSTLFFTFLGAPFQAGTFRRPPDCSSNLCPSKAVAI